MAIILTDDLSLNHSAPLISKSGCTSMVLILFTLLLPLFLVTQTHNYWVETYTYSEQPNIKHMNEIMVFLYTDTDVYTFASTKNLNDLLDSSGEHGNALSPEFTVSTKQYPNFFIRSSTKTTTMTERLIILKSTLESTLMAQSPAISPFCNLPFSRSTPKSALISTFDL